MSTRKDLACEVDFRVIDESENWIVVSKPAPLIVHPTDKGGQATLLGGLEQLLAFDIANGAKLSIINRLDRETSGVVLIAKNKTWARAFGRAMERRLFKKEYLAIVNGRPDWSEKEVNVAIGNQRDVQPSKVWLKQMVQEGGRESNTTFQKLGSYGEYCLLRAKPKTGRMHQIRVHAAHLGFPLLGDKIYGSDETCYLDFMKEGWTAAMQSRLTIARHALHGCYLSVEVDGELFEWSDPLAGDLQQFLDGHSSVTP